MVLQLQDGNEQLKFICFDPLLISRFAFELSFFLKLGSGARNTCFDALAIFLNGLAFYKVSPFRSTANKDFWQTQTM